MRKRYFLKLFWCLSAISNVAFLSACQQKMSIEKPEETLTPTETPRDSKPSPNPTEPPRDSKPSPTIEKKSNPRDGEKNSKYSFNISPNSPNFRFAIPKYNPSTGEEFDFPSLENRPDLDNGVDQKGQPVSVTEPQTGYSPNKHYDRNFNTSFNLVFENQEKNKEGSSTTTERGTGWILDYQKTIDNTYPTIWYIASNVHVIDKLISRNSYAPYNDSTTNALETINFQMIKWTPHDKGYKTWPWHENNALRRVYETGNIRKEPHPSNAIKGIPKTVFLGIDFLDTTPKQFSKKLFDEEVIDFGVIEVEFTSPEIARAITSNYANWDESEKNKFLQTSYLKKTEQIKPYSFYLAGFPGGVPTINRDKIEYENSDLPQWREEETSEQEKKYQSLRERGSSLGHWEYLSTFGPNAPKGIGDATLFLPYFFIFYRGKKYTPAGLTYSITSGRLVGGSSGSKVTNQNGEIVSIHAIGYLENNASVSFALRSEGFDQPAYHSYKTPAYDIIYGGFSGQKNSYYQAMKKIYESKPGLTTDLFKNWNRIIEKN